MASLRTVLLVDGNRHERERVAIPLRKEIDCVVLEVDTAEEALEVIEREKISVLLADVCLPQKSGIELIRNVQKIDPGVVPVGVVPLHNREMEVDVLKMGAFFYIHTPYDFSEAVIATSRALTFYDFRAHGEPRGAQVRKRDGFFGIIGESPRIESLFRVIEKVAADGESSVLIYGESGTGKELVSRAVHGLSPRKGKNLVPVNCAAIPDDLLESELFGYVKGAFTGANQSKIGRIQYADGGTLFLDEIGDMKSNLQAKLLRVLQEKEFEPVGGVKAVPVDVRVVAATHRDLEKLVEEGKFREDLYYRLNVVPVTIPPLRERKEDIPLLIEQFVQYFGRNKNCGPTEFAPELIAVLTEYPWPGNVRELKNLVQRMIVLHGGSRIGLAELPSKYFGEGGELGQGEAEKEPSVTSVPSVQKAPTVASWDDGKVDFNTLVSSFEDRLILQALTRTNGNKKEAAELLNLKRTTLLEKIKKKGIEEKNLTV